MAIPGLGVPTGLFVLGDGTRLVSTLGHTILAHSRTGRLSVIAGSHEESLRDGEGTSAHFNYPRGLTVDKAGNIVVVDSESHGIRTRSSLRLPG